MSKKTESLMNIYYKNLIRDALESNADGSQRIIADNDWHRFSIKPSNNTGMNWAIIRNREASLDIYDVGFWLNQAHRVSTGGGSFEYRFCEEEQGVRFRNVNVKYVWHDRIDSNPNRKDPLWFYALEYVNRIRERIINCDFPVEISWQDRRMSPFDPDAIPDY